jgi:queuine/archaeosine tRNA-ribosyltransferase
MTDKIKQDLKAVADALIDSYEQTRKADPEWQLLFKNVDGVDFKSLLREAAHKMQTIALDVYSLIEEQLTKEGKETSREILDVTYALPFLERRLAKHACDTEYSACSVDKAFYILNKYINEQESK